MKKWNYTPIQLLAMCALVIMGITMSVSDNPLKNDAASAPPEKCTFHYIDEGTYTLTVSVTPSDEENRVTIFTDAAVDSNGKTGIVIAQADLNPGQNSVSIPFSLEEGTFSVSVATDLDTEDESYATGAHLESDGALYRDGAFLGSLMLAAALLLAVIFLKVPREQYIFPLGAVSIGILAGIPIYMDFVLGGHDLAFHFYRIEGLYRALSSGDFPARLNPLEIYGHGYVSATMYPQMLLYPIAMLRFLDVSLSTCYKFFLAALNIGTALTTYYAVKNMTGSKKMGILASFLYTFSAYRLVAMYVRASVGELSAMAFLPLVAWGVYECLWGRQKRWPILVLGMTGVLESHVLSTEMCALFLLLELFWWLCSRRKSDVKSRIMAGARAVAVTLLLNLTFLVPFLYFSTQNLQCFGQSSILSNHVVYFSQMFSLFLKTGGSSLPRGTTVNEMPLTVGTALLTGLIVFFVWSGKSTLENSKGKRHMIGIHCAAYSVLALFMMSWLMPWSGLITRLPLLYKLTASIQFVWRFLGPASLFMALCTSIALVAASEENKEHAHFTGIVVTLCLVSSMSLFDDLKNFEQQFRDPMSIEWAIPNLDELYLYSGDSRFAYFWGDEPRTASRTAVAFSDYRKNGTRISANVTPSEHNADDYVLFPLYYYPGYEIKINGEKTGVFAIDSLVACKLPSAPSKIEIRYAGFPIFRAADLVSLLTGLGICGLFLMKRFKKKL